MLFFCGSSLDPIPESPKICMKYYNCYDFPAQHGSPLSLLCPIFQYVFPIRSHISSTLADGTIQVRRKEQELKCVFVLGYLCFPYQLSHLRPGYQPDGKNRSHSTKTTCMVFGVSFVSSYKSIYVRIHHYWSAAATFCIYTSVVQDCYHFYQLSTEINLHNWHNSSNKQTNKCQM